MTLEAGQVLQNRYRIVSPLKRGGMGAIYRAWDTRLSVAVALKEMIPQPGLEPHILSQLRHQFQREATTLARLDHPNLVGVIDFFEEEGNAYLVMKFVEGESLAERIERQGALSEEEVLVWADQLLDALAYCHEQGVLHRDIKPQNAIIRPDGRVILVDFGLVKLWNPQAPETRTAVRGTGTPEYAPPEQYDTGGTGHTDPRTDIYSLGATLYHALVGQAPPTATQRIVNPASLAPVRTVNPRVSPRVETALMRALELQPPDRFQNTAEMRAVLRGTAPIPPPPQPPTATKVMVEQPSPAKRTVTRIGMAAGVVLGVVLLGGAILGAVWLFGDRQPSPPATSQAPATFASEAVPQVIPTATDVPPTPTSTPTPQEPTSTPLPTSTSRPTVTPMPTQTPTPAETPTPAAAALVLADGADLRPGATTWWRVRKTLPAGTELELAGYDPNFPDWVYVRTLDGASSGWTQITALEINRDLTDLPRVTPIPTLTSTPRATEVLVPTLPAGCVTGPLELDAWPVGAVCVPGGWIATIYAQGRGGNCVYTYAWEGIVQVRSTTGPATFEVRGGYGAIVGTVSVTSAGQTVNKGVFVQKPDCD